MENHRLGSLAILPHKLAKLLTVGNTNANVIGKAVMISLDTRKQKEENDALSIL